MSNLHVVDTHTLLWFLDNHKKLGVAAAKILADPNVILLLPAIVLSEAFFIIEKGRTPFSITELDLLQAVKDDTRFVVIPLDEPVVNETLQCKVIPEMHDRQIVATALLAQTAEIQVAILTRDENIQNCGLVQTIW
ncbi:MAG: PIN domain-containing protein [Caldilineaceae bacterium]